MRNNKFKHIQYNMQAQMVFVETGKNVRTFYLALLSTGLKKETILDFDEYFHGKVPKARQDSVDDIFGYKVKKVLETHNIPFERIRMYAESHNGANVRKAYPNEDSYNTIIEQIATDIGNYFVMANEYLGYGHIRCMRVLEFMERYTGDSLEEAREKLNISYGDPNELPDMSVICPRKKQFSRNEAIKLRGELDKFQAYIEAVKA